MGAASNAGRTWRGTVYVYTAFDVGHGIDLNEAERRIRGQRDFLKRLRRTPKYFDYQPPPVRTIQSAAPRALGRFFTANQVDLVLYDFGAVSVAHAVFVDAASIPELIDLSIALTQETALLDEDRMRVQLLSSSVAPAIHKPFTSDFYERYVVFHFLDSSPAWMAEASAEMNAMVAALLRAEPNPLSPQEINDALQHRISYGEQDMVTIDWDAALVWGTEMDDVLAVLEFANVELLEMRFLDQQLDAALDEAYEALSRRRTRLIRLPGSVRGDIQRIAQLQVDNAMLFEGVNNALKLIGDQYLARVYHLASERFHLPEWDTSILRKLQTLESIYEKMSDVATAYRMEILEWIIILLIALSIVLPFLSGTSSH